MSKVVTVSFFIQRLIPCILSYFEYLKIKVLDTALDTRLTGNEIGISIHQNLSFGVDNHKQIRC